MDHLYIFCLLALLAEVLGTVGGFGSSMFFVPIAAYFLDFHSVLGVTALYHLSSNVAKIALFRKGFDKKLALAMGIPAVIFVILGAYASKLIPARNLEIVLGIFLISLSLIFLVFKQLRLRPTIYASTGGGILSGFVAGLLGTGGAIRGIALAVFNLRIDVFIATSAIIDLAIDFSRSIVYYTNGYMHKDDVYLIPILLVISIIGTYIGKKVLDRVSEEQFRSIVLILIFITGLITLLNVVKF